MRPPGSNYGPVGVAATGQRSTKAGRARGRRIALIRARALVLKERAERASDGDGED